LQKAVARFPDYAMAWAMLSYAYLDEYRWGFNPSSPGTEPIARSLEAARTAVRLEPDNVRALPLFFSRDVPGAMAVAERALALDPNDTEIMGEVGTRVGFAGDWNRAISLLERAFDANPAHSDYYRSNLAFAAYMKGDVGRAVQEIRGANQDELPMVHLLAAIFYAEGGLAEQANASRDKFLSLRPTFFDNLKTELDRRNFLPRDRARFVEGLVKAGFPVPPHLRVQTLPRR
jgi:adenylate cyclase